VEGSKKIMTIDFADMSGGVNSIEYPIAIGANQVQPGSIGAILRKSGFLKYPGAQGLSSTTTFTDYLRLLFSFRDFAGVERLLALSGGDLSSVNTSTGAPTTLYTMGAPTGEGWATEAFGKCFLCNGNKVIKLEAAVGYPVGITAPAGVAAAASAGAGLPDGNYVVYAGYARRVGGVDKLYSKGQLIGTVTLGTGNNRISVSSFANSTDPQVGNKVIWIQSPAEVVAYYFYGTGDNTTTSFVISATTSKDTTNVYETNAADNGLPPAGTFIFSFANRLWIVKDNIIYFSNKAYSEYDLEVFAAANFITTPYHLTGIFSVGTDLFFNTDQGILIMQSGDSSTVLYLIEPRWHFEYMRTVARWNNGVIGVTNDGVRMFDGEKFTDYDMSYSIKSVIHTLYNAATNFQPCGYVYRRDIRNEYHLMWQDQSGALSTTTNNQHWIFNLDTAQKGQDIYGTADNLAWEQQAISGNFAAVSRNNNTVFIGQSHASASKIYTESGSTDMNKDVYDISGNLLADDTVSQMQVITRENTPDIAGRLKGMKYYVLAQASQQFEVEFCIGTETNDKGALISTGPIKMGSGATGGAKFDEDNYDEGYYGAENPQIFRDFFPENFNGGSIYAKITQAQNDLTFKLLVLRAFVEVETGNFI
jgi:hypothetical protein